MNKIVSKLLSGLFLTSLVTGLGISISNAHDKPIESIAIGNYSTSASTYYNGITASSGKQLAAQLHDLITSTHQYYSSYDDNGSNGYQKETDRYYENGVAQKGYIYEFYSGVKWPDAWAASAGNTSGGYNREHCWCQSNSVNSSGTKMWGETGGGADMHHLRPVEVRLNSTRGNHPYGEISNRDSYKLYAKYGSQATYALGGYYTNDTFEPIDAKKGDVARIILYTYLHYNSYTVNDLFGGYGTTNGSGNSGYFSSSLLSVTKIMKPSSEASALELLLDWNNADPVDDIETRRNEQVAKYQGNRNPFIDNSNYANLIWGSGTMPTNPTVNSVSVSPTELNLDVNGTTAETLTATVLVSNGAPQTVTWASSNENVATVSDNGVVTAVAKGACTVTATSTYNPNKSASCTVKVADTSGSGQTHDETGDFTWNLAIASYDSGASEDLVKWSHEYATMEHIRTDSKKTKANNYLGGSYSSSRFYNGNTLKITPLAGCSVTSVVFAATTANYASALNNSSWTNASSSISSMTVTVTPIDGSSVFSAVISGTCGFTSVKVYYSTSVSVFATLESIALNTSNVQTEFYVNDTFDFSGLVVTAYYDDGTEDIVTPKNVSTPDMSSTGEKTVTVSYIEGSVTKTADYTINVIEKPVTSITATVEKTYHPGNVIVTSDIYVENDLGEEVTAFEFANDGYRFTYDDAPSGGEQGTKTFDGAVSFGDFSCDVTVNVSRIAYESGSNTINDTLDREFTGIPDTNYSSWSGKTVANGSGVVYAGQSAGGNSSIQLRSSNSNSGIIVTSNPNNLPCLSITVTWNSSTASGRTIDIYGKTSAYSSPTELYSTNSGTQGTILGSLAKGTTSLTISGEYPFIGIRSRSGALWLTSIVISYPAVGNDTALNVANFIMINDTEGQCETKLDQAITKLNSMSTTEKNTFSTSTDYVISTARTRLYAWAAHEGKILTFVNGVYTLNAGKIAFISNDIDDNQTLPIIMICFVALFSGASAYCFIKKRNEA